MCVGLFNLAILKTVSWRDAREQSVFLKRLCAISNPSEVWTGDQ